MKRNPYIIVTTSVVALALGLVVVKSLTGETSFFTRAQGCEHVGYHYLSKEATETESGWKEFWTCCKCNEAFLEQPLIGDFTTQSSTLMTGGEPGPGHIAYIPVISPMAQYTQNLYMHGDTFKILNLTDIQLHDGNSTDFVFHIMDSIVEKEQPDMITLLGDNVNDHLTYGVRVMAQKIFDHVDSFGIPWAPIFGNHDQDDYRPEGTKKDLSTDEMIEMFSKCDNCLFIRGPKDIVGKSNYMVNVYQENSTQLVKSLIFMDSRGHGTTASNATFYENCVNYSTEINGGNVVPSVLFQHIPLRQYYLAFQNSEKNEMHDVVGSCCTKPLFNDTTDDVWNKIKELGSTNLVMCGHDHQNSYYVDYEDVRLCYAMKSSEGDDADGNSFKYAMGGTMLDINDEIEDIRYSPLNDIPYTIQDGEIFDYHSAPVSYWRGSGAKLVCDIELPNTGSIRVNVQGTNLLRTSVPYDERVKSWNRLSEHVVINAETKTAPKGTLTLLHDNVYRYELDLLDLALNTAESAHGDETERLFLFQSISGEFGISNVHCEYEEVVETDQKDLSHAVISDIPEQTLLDELVPLRPEVTVTLDGETLTLFEDYIVKYENNTQEGTATAIIVPSGKGAHNYKGQASTTFNIIDNTSGRDLHSFEADTDLTVTLNRNYGTTESITVDFKINDGGTVWVAFVAPDTWDNYYGYYGIKQTGTVNAYPGVSTALLSDGYIRVVFNFAQAVIRDAKALPTESVNKFYVRGGWTHCSGFFEINPEGGQPLGTLLCSDTFTGGKEQKVDFSEVVVKATDTLIVDIVYQSGTKIFFRISDGWGEHTGNYGIVSDGSTSGGNFNGVTIEVIKENHVRMTIDLSKADGPETYSSIISHHAWGNATAQISIYKAN